MVYGQHCCPYTRGVFRSCFSGRIVTDLLADLRESTTRQYQSYWAAFQAFLHSWDLPELSEMVVFELLFCSFIIFSRLHLLLPVTSRPWQIPSASGLVSHWTSALWSCSTGGGFTPGQFCARLGFFGPCIRCWIGYSRRILGSRLPLWGRGSESLPGLFYGRSSGFPVSGQIIFGPVPFTTYLPFSAGLSSLRNLAACHVAIRCSAWLFLLPFFTLTL